MVTRSFVNQVFSTVGSQPRRLTTESVFVASRWVRFGLCYFGSVLPTGSRVARRHRVTTLKWPPVRCAARRDFNAHRSEGSSPPGAPDGLFASQAGRVHSAATQVETGSHFRWKYVLLHPRTGHASSLAVGQTAVQLLKQVSLWSS